MFFGQVTIDIRFPDANASDDLACGVNLAARMQAREGEFHGLMLDCCLPSRRLAGSALEERRFTARKTLSQQVQQISRFSNLIFVKSSKMELTFVYAGVLLHNLQNWAVWHHSIANEVITYHCCGGNLWSFRHM